MTPLTPDLCRQIVTASMAHLAGPVDEKGFFAYAHPAGDVSAGLICAGGLAGDFFDRK